MIEIRLTTVDRLDEALALPAGAVGLGQEGCLTKFPDTDELRQAADRVRAAGRTVVVVAPIAWPRTADELHKRLLAVIGDGPTTVAANDLGTLMSFVDEECTVVAGLGLTRNRPHSADSGPPRAQLDVSLMTVLAGHGVTAVEIDTDIAVTDPRWETRQLVDAVPVGYGRSCPTARRHRTGPPGCQALCDEPYQITVNARWQLNHGHREPLPAGGRQQSLTVWGNAVYQPATAEPTGDYRIIDARWHTAESLAATVHEHEEKEHRWSTSH